jgi:hypothetical protein
VISAENSLDLYFLVIFSCPDFLEQILPNCGRWPIESVGLPVS